MPQHVYGQNSTAHRGTYGASARSGFTYEVALNGFFARMPATVAARPAKDSMVDYVEPDRAVSTQMTHFGPVCGLDRIDQASLPMSNTFSYTRTGIGVRIYIIDTGVRITHDQFRTSAGGSRAAYSWDFVDGDALADDRCRAVSEGKADGHSS